MFLCQCTICFITLKAIEKQLGVYMITIAMSQILGIIIVTEIEYIIKTSITGKLENNENESEDIKVVVPLKHFSNFWRTTDILLVGFEISLILKWSKDCVLTSKATRNALDAQEDNPAVV